MLPDGHHVKQKEVFASLVFVCLSLAQPWHHHLICGERLTSWHVMEQPRQWWGSRRTIEALFRGTQANKISEGGSLLVTTHPEEKEWLWVFTRHWEWLSVCVELHTESFVKLNYWIFFSKVTEFTKIIYIKWLKMFKQSKGILKVCLVNFLN